MTYANTTLLGLNQPTTGSESGVWGDDVNNGFTQLVDISVAGTNNITQDSDITLSVTNGNNSSSFSTTGSNSTVAQYAVLNCTGSRTAARNIIVPASSKLYVVYNNTSGGYAITVKKSAGTGVSIANGEKALVYYDSITATDVVKIVSTTQTAAAGTLTGTTLNSTVVTSSLTSVGTVTTGTWNASVIGAAYGGTGVANNAANTITFTGSYSLGLTLTANTTATLPTSGYHIATVTNMAANPVTGTPSSTTYLRGDGTWATISTSSGTVTSVSGTGTVNGITLTGTVTSSGSLTLGGTLSGVSLTSQVSGTLPIANGGTNSTATPTAGGIGYGTGSAYAFSAAGTSGYLLISGGTGSPTWTTTGSGVVTALGNSTNSSGGFTTIDGTATLTNKRINPRVSATSSASSLTPDISAYDEYAYTALSSSLTINAPTGSPVDGNKLIFRILDNGSSQSLSWNGTYTVIGVTLPTATTASKTTYVGCIYNANNSRWDVVAVTTQV